MLCTIVGCEMLSLHHDAYSNPQDLARCGHATRDGKADPSRAMRGAENGKEDLRRVTSTVVLALVLPLNSLQ